LRPVAILHGTVATDGTNFLFVGFFLVNFVFKEITGDALVEL
jgi:hypothetical protein